MTDPVRYENVLNIDAWGVSVSTEEHEDACLRMQDYLTAHEGDALSISVRPSRGGRDHHGLFRFDGYGRSVPATEDEREELKDLLDAAWEHACETWPE